MSSARQRPLVIGLGLLLTALAGCGVGQVTQTARQQTTVNGASGQAGPIVVRDAVFVFPAGEQHFYPRGSSVPLKLTIVNTGGSPDRLARVSSPVAGSVQVSGQTTIPGNSSVRAVSHVVTEPHEGESSTPAPTTTSAPASATSAEPTSAEPTSVVLTTAEPTTAGPTDAGQTTAGPTAAVTTTAGTTPTGPTATGTSAGGSAAPTPSNLPAGELSIMLMDLAEDIRPGRTVRVVLLFEQAGEVVLQVPIGAPDEPRGESGH